MSRKNNFIYCNCCGGEICTEQKKEVTSFLTINKEWGYFSQGKDGVRHNMDICETCYDKFVQSFAIQPEIKQITEYL